ncbi:phosphatidylglycerophosphatase A family protein [Desulfuribacillus alkaliarsenatis]|uniref:Phosphatidylglycerophosphatase A n=1 Tax=Desulfuribacillus alkaliarsenatis TaxID=766136 RepID=A0A1E5FYQ6_9FIRM|nr:phosphatidylglycerophosphatase A [Desulfuribacillus alkaliarsenatis]OEF95577.1 phosphatidylglycerophosphatase A [Desulfuribacillus alkaliarsenatis]
MNKQQEAIVNLLQERGVTVADIADIVYKLQSPYVADISKEVCEESILRVLNKREVQFTLYTGIALDQLAEKNLLPEPLQGIIETDEPLYGVDEVLAAGITNVYGSIGLTSFGYLDKEKLGIIRKLDNHADQIHTFLDDLVAGIAAAASARIAHQSIGSYLDHNIETKKSK